MNEVKPPTSEPMTAEKAPINAVSTLQLWTCVSLEPTYIDGENECTLSRNQGWLAGQAEVEGVAYPLEPYQRIFHCRRGFRPRKPA
jgi:hypothetical protein